VAAISAPFMPRIRKAEPCEKYIRENISEDLECLYTDDWKASRSTARKFRRDGRHKTIHHQLDIYAMGDVYTNTVESAFSLLKRSGLVVKMQAGVVLRQTGPFFVCPHKVPVHTVFLKINTG
jgi:hypothetical protein